MCGRYTLSAEAEQLQQTFNLDSIPEIQPRYNIAPTQPVPIITNAAPKEVTLVQWGLVPSWAKDTKMAAKMINARGETVHEKPSFRAPFKRRRCLIPVSGFYEWTKTDDGKQPHFIHLPDEPVFAFAGLWEVWTKGGGEVWTCTIITTEANDKIRDLHHRMPVILDQAARDIWLDNASEPDELRMLLQSYDGDKMDHYTVSKSVNSVKNDNPTLIERDNPPQQKSMF